MILQPIRFCEWGQAAWKLQKQFLDNESPWDVRFLALYHESDAAACEASKELISGKALDQWWDVSEEAGPKSRESEPFKMDIPTLECLTVADGGIKILGLDLKHLTWAGFESS